MNVSISKPPRADKMDFPERLRYTHNVDYWTATDIGLPSAEIDVGNLNSLTTFIDFVLGRQEAEHYALCIFNHGDGVYPTLPRDPNEPIKIGIAFDNGFVNGPYLSIEELGQACEHFEITIGHNFDILHLAACLMQMIEVNQEVRQFCDYVIGSENEGWVCGSVGEWETGYLDSITNSTTNNQLANSIATNWFNAMAPFGSTVSVLKSSYTDNVSNAVDGLANALINNMRLIRDSIATARNNAQKFAIFDTDNTMTQSNVFLDLRDLCFEITQNITNASEVVNAANVVIDIIGSDGGNYINWENHQNEAGATINNGYWFDAGTHGISIYFPETTTPEPQGWPSGYWNYVNVSDTPANLSFCEGTH